MKINTILGIGYFRINSVVPFVLDLDAYPLKLLEIQDGLPIQ